ncbi:HNH endonuclease [Segetibacter koreensis]|uniref:HNH endonuclease n=1 Tax=Segetibacter koreensis TaxID=398037 RepID=UPI0003616411|nr:HNH endonuclease [Segetibacter koreensis]
MHRLLALAYVPNPDGKPYVNHINEIKTDIRPENLEWSTHQENVLHAYRTGLISKKSQMKIVVDRCTGETFQSVKEAAQARSIPYSTCKNYLNGRRPNITSLRYAA